MSRRRVLRPDFWIDERIPKLSFEARLFYLGLKNLADDDGYVECRPDRLRAQILPYDRVNANGIVSTLLDHDFVNLLEDESHAFWLQINDWNGEILGVKRNTALSIHTFSVVVERPPELSMKGAITQTEPDIEFTQGTLTEEESEGYSDAEIEAIISGSKAIDLTGAYGEEEQQPTPQPQASPQAFETIKARAQLAKEMAEKPKVHSHTRIPI